MLSYEDKRDYLRMDMDCPVSYALINGDQKGEGIAKDLSAKGLLMWVKEPVEAEQILAIQLTPENDITPPLLAQVRVVRCSELEEQPGTYAIACETQKILPSN